MTIDSFCVATLVDAREIAELVNKSYRPEPGAFGWTHESDLVSGNRTDANQIEKIISKSDCVILAGLKGREVVACVCIEKEGNNSNIGMLAVNPTMQGLGVGKQMLFEAERYANVVFGSEKCVMVVVASRDELVSFYLRRGYQKTGAVMDYPLSARAGIPKAPNLKVAFLEKRLLAGG